MESVRAERERCAEIVEAHLGEFESIEASLLMRIVNQIRGSMLPESFAEQVVSEETTEYYYPGSAAEERTRCLECVRSQRCMATGRLLATLLEIERLIAL